MNDYAGFPPEASPWYQHGRMNVGFAVEGTSVLSPSLVLSSRAGFIRHDFYIATHGDNFDPATLGFPSSFTSQLERQTFPQIQWDGYTTFGSTFGGNNGSIFTVSDTWSWSEVLSKTSGNHSFKFGGELRALVNNQQNPTSSTGRFTFNRAFTQRNALAGPRCRELGRVAAPRLPGRQLDDDGAQRVADLSRSSTTAGSTSACSCRTTGGSTRG